MALLSLPLLALRAEGNKSGHRILPADSTQSTLLSSAQVVPRAAARFHILAIHSRSPAELAST